MGDVESKHRVADNNNDKQTEREREREGQDESVREGFVVKGWRQVGLGGVRDSRRREMEASCAFA